MFGALTGAETNPQLQAVNREVTPLVSALRDEVRLNEKLFQRIKAVYDARATLKLTPIQIKLVEEVYKGYVRAGANLDPAKKEQLKKINAEMSMLTLKFGDNQLHDTNEFKLVIDRQEDLKGLPPSVVAGGAAAAKAANMPGKWVYTLQAPSIWPFLQYADNRELRRQILAAYTSRGDHGDEWDNKKTLSRIAALRVERAQLMGYKSYADFVARREHVEDAGRRLQPAQPAVDARAQRRAPRGRRPAGGDRQGGRQRSSSRPATGATTPRRCARRGSTSTSRRSGPTSSWTTSCRAPSPSPTSSTASRSRRVPTSRSTTPRSRRTR